MNYLNQDRNRFAIRANRTINSQINALFSAKKYTNPEVEQQVNFAIATLRDLRHELAAELAYHHFPGHIVVQRDEFEADFVEEMLSPSETELNDELTVA